MESLKWSVFLPFISKVSPVVLLFHIYPIYVFLFLFTENLFSSQGQEWKELCNGICSPDEGGWDRSPGWITWSCGLQGENQLWSFCGGKTSVFINEFSFSFFMQRAKLNNKCLKAGSLKDFFSAGIIASQKWRFSITLIFKKVAHQQT